MKFEALNGFVERTENSHCHSGLKKKQSAVRRDVAERAARSLSLLKKLSNPFIRDNILNVNKNTRSDSIPGMRGAAPPRSALTPRALRRIDAHL